MLIARIIGTVSPWINHSGTKNTFNMLLLAQTEVFVDGLLTHSDAMLLLFVPCVFFMKKLSVFMQTWCNRGDSSFEKVVPSCGSDRSFSKWYSQQLFILFVMAWCWKRFFVCEIDWCSCNYCSQNMKAATCGWNHNCLTHKVFPGETNRIIMITWYRDLLVLIVSLEDRISASCFTRQTSHLGALIIGIL